MQPSRLKQIKWSAWDFVSQHAHCHGVDYIQLHFKCFLCVCTLKKIISRLIFDKYITSPILKEIILHTKNGYDKNEKKKKEMKFTSAVYYACSVARRNFHFELLPEMKMPWLLRDRAKHGFASCVQTLHGNHFQNAFSSLLNSQINRADVFLD